MQIRLFHPTPSHPPRDSIKCPNPELNISLSQAMLYRYSFHSDHDLRRLYFAVENSRCRSLGSEYIDCMAHCLFLYVPTYMQYNLISLIHPLSPSLPPILHIPNSTPYLTSTTPLSHSILCPDKCTSYDPVQNERIQREYTQAKWGRLARVAFLGT
jgi:hypothetical protein